MSTQTEATFSLQGHKEALREQAGERGPAHAVVERISDSLAEQESGTTGIEVVARPDPGEPPADAGSATETGTSVDEAFSKATSEVGTDDTNAPAEPGDRSDDRGRDGIAIDAAAATSEGNGAAAADKVVDETASGTDVADPDEAVVGADDPNVADQPDGASEAEVRLETDCPTAADSSGSSSGEADDEQAVPRFLKMELANLLDETMGDLVALENFGRTVIDRAFENEWHGAHNDISLEAIREELLRKRKYTAHIDDAGNLLSDPEEYRLAVKLGVQITLCVHRGRTKDQKREFILRSQTGKRMLTEKQQRELKNSLMLVRLRLGVDYETISKMFGVSQNTVRNVETRAAADPNSKFGITKRPDGRFKPATREKIAKAAELRKAGMGDADIAAMFDTDVETVSKWFKDPSARDKAKMKAKPGKKLKNGRGNSAAQPADPIENIAASDGVPERHRRALEHLGLDASAYAEWLKEAFEKAQQDSGAAAGDLEELVKAELYFTQRAEVEKSRQRQILSPAGEADVEEAPGDSRSDGTGPTQVGDILLGIVKSIEPDKVSVALSVGHGIIDTRDEYPAIYAPLQEKGAVRVRVEGFDRKRQAWKVKLQGQQTFAPAPGATAVRSDSDDRSSPYADLAGRKAGPKDKEVTR